MTEGREVNPPGASEWVGRSSHRTVDITEESVHSFATISGDFSPIHMDADSARQEGFVGPVTHGLLVGAYVSGLIGMKLPGAGSVLKSFHLDFRRPAIYPCRLEILVTVVKHVASVRLVELAIEVRGQGDELLAVGRADCILNTECE